MSCRPSLNLRHNAVPLFVAGALIAKKLALYAVARSYGLPRCYRRALELERQLYPQASIEFKRSLRSNIKFALRAPDQAMHVITHNQHVQKFIADAVNKGSTKGMSAAAFRRGVEQLKSVLAASGVDLQRLLNNSAALKSNTSNNSDRPSTATNEHNNGKRNSP